MVSGPPQSVDSKRPPLVARAIVPMCGRPLVPTAARYGATLRASISEAQVIRSIVSCKRRDLIPCSSRRRRGPLLCRSARQWSLASSLIWHFLMLAHLRDPRRLGQQVTERDMSRRPRSSAPSAGVSSTANSTSATPFALAIVAVSSAGDVENQETRIPMPPSAAGSVTQELAHICRWSRVRSCRIEGVPAGSAQRLAICDVARPIRLSV